MSKVLSAARLKEKLKALENVEKSETEGLSQDEEPAALNSAELAPNAPKFAPNFMRIYNDTAEMEVQIGLLNARLQSFHGEEHEATAKYWRDVVRSDIERLRKLQDRCGIDANASLPRLDVAEPEECDDRLTEIPVAWKREEDDPVVYSRHVKAVKLFAVLQALQCQVTRTECAEQAVVGLQAMHSRLLHRHCECLDLLQYLGRVDDFVQAVLNEGVRSKEDEESIRRLAQAAAVEELRTKNSNPAIARLRPLSKKELAICRASVTVPLRSEELIVRMRARYEAAKKLRCSDCAEGYKIWRRLQEEAQCARAALHADRLEREERRLQADAKYQTVVRDSVEGSLRRLP